MHKIVVIILILSVSKLQSVWSFMGDEDGIGMIVPISFIISAVGAVVLGATITISLHILLSPKHKTDVKAPKEIVAFHRYMESLDLKHSGRLKRKEVLFGRKLEASINEIIDCVIESKVLPWYSSLVDVSSPSIDTLRNILWYSIGSMHESIIKVDNVKLVMCGAMTCLTRHLETIRVAQSSGESQGERGIFLLAPHLSSPVRERSFLRLVAEFFIIKTLPKEYHDCSVVRKMLKELIACKLLEPLIDGICDPDWINLQLLQYLRQQQAAEELHTRTYHYAASYEDFISLIYDSTDVNELRHFRRNIINEIMQATAINNLKKAKGLDTSKECTPQGTGKGDLLQARNLKRYINQLTYAKAQCEKRITTLNNRSNSRFYTTLDTIGVPMSATSDATNIEFGNTAMEDDLSLIQGSSLQNLPGRKILMLQVILETAFARRYFAIYLDEIGHGSLLSFWSAVRELKQADRRQHYQLGVEIYHTYLAQQPAPVKVDKVYLRGVEAFLLGNRGPEVLYEIAEDVERTLEDRHYPGFLVSSTYHAMLKQAEAQGIDFMSSSQEDSSASLNCTEAQSETVDSSQLQLSQHSTYARNKLAYLQERLTNKLLALQAIQQTKKADPKVIIHLESEIASIRSAHHQLEAHVERTALWSQNIGQWRVRVTHVLQAQNSDKEDPTLVLDVHLGSVSPIQELTPTSSSNNGVMETEEDRGELSTPLSYCSSLLSSGWTVNRKLSLLLELHRKLCPIAPWIRSTELPTVQSKLLFSKQLDKSQLDRIQYTSNHYFNTIMTNERLCSSELIYAFLSPSPEHLKQVPQPKKTKFSLSTLFKGSEKHADLEEEEVGSLIMCENPVEGGAGGAEGVTEGGRDPVAEPLFAFLEELCELRGVGKWLRKTLVSFVQITYGKNITRHVRETVQGMFSEPMLLYYLQTFKAFMWPSEELVSQQGGARTHEQIVATRREAEELFVQSLPELLCTLVGQQNARRGAARLFCTLQHHALNKNLFYGLLEVVLKELFPEIKEKVTKN